MTLLTFALTRSIETRQEFQQIGEKPEELIGGGDNVVEKPEVKLIVTSTAFAEGQMIPSKHTSDGENTSPDISWQGAPEETKTFVLIAEDPDVPMKGLSLLTFVHWLVYDIPSTITSLPEAITGEETLDNAAKQGKTSLGRIGYAGPRPPFGTHRYYFKVYALDTEIGLKQREATRRKILSAIEGHVLAYGELMGKYKRHR